MARPTDYKPEVEGCVYHLKDDDGVFYVGSTRRPAKRLSAYKSGRFHGNKALESRASKGFSFVVVYVGSDYKDEEMRQINSIPGLTNIITGPKAYFGRQSGKSAFGWFVREYRNRFGSTPFLSDLRAHYRQLSPGEKARCNAYLYAFKELRT